MSDDVKTWMSVVDRFARINEVYRKTLYDIATFDDVNIDDARALARAALINAAIEHARAKPA